MDIEAYLAELQAAGQQTSNGAFTCDLRRMQEVLGRHQLARPEEYVLAVISAAVLQRANTFSLQQQGRVTRLSWDGPPLTPEQLQSLLPSLGQPRSALAELAVALLTAGRLGEVRLFSEGGEVRFSNRKLAMELRFQPGCGNTFELRRSGWRGWLPLSPPEIRLLQRARRAPLRLSPSPRPVRTRSTPLALCFGHPPPHDFEAQEWVQLPHAPWGQGLLLLGTGPWEIVRDGISYYQPSATPGIQVLWWSDRFSLDLSRQQFVENDEFQEWKNWLLGQFAREVLARGMHCSYPWLIDQALRDPHSPLLEAPVFRRGDQSPMPLRTLRDFYAQQGWLPVVSRPMDIEWDPHCIVITQSKWELELRRVFPNWFQLDKLEGQVNIPRLPPEEEYLVRMPLLDPPGEAGLRAYPTFAFRCREHGTWHERHLHPFGVDTSRSEESGLNLVALYACLHELVKRPGCQDTAQWHILACFLWLQASLYKKLPLDGKKSHPLAVLLQPARQVRLGNPNGGGSLTSSQLVALASRAHFRSERGMVALADLLHRDRPVRISQCGWDPPLQDVSTDHWGCWALTLLLRENGVEAMEGHLRLTSLAYRLLSAGGGPVALFRRLLLNPNTQAYQMLEESGRRAEWLAATRSLADPQDALDSVVDFLRQEPLWPGLSFNSPHLLLALCQQPSLQGLGLHSDWLLPQLAARGQLEAAAEWRWLLAMPGQDAEGRNSVRALLTECYESREEWDTVLQLCELLPGRQAFYRKAAVAHRRGDFTTALGHLEKLQEFAPNASFLAWQAELLMLLGRRQEALARLPTESNSYADYVRSRLLDDPQQALDLLDSALTKPHPVLDIWEQRGIRLAQLHRPQEARQSLARFLRARPDIYPRFNLLERQRQARQLVDSLPPDPGPPQNS